MITSKHCIGSPPPPGDARSPSGSNVLVQTLNFASIIYFSQTQLAVITTGTKVSQLKANYASGRYEEINYALKKVSVDKLAKNIALSKGGGGENKTKKEQDHRQVEPSIPASLTCTTPAVRTHSSYNVDNTRSRGITSPPSDEPRKAHKPPILITGDRHPPKADPTRTGMVDNRRSR